MASLTAAVSAGTSLFNTYNSARRQRTEDDLARRRLEEDAARRRAWQEAQRRQLDQDQKADEARFRLTDQAAAGDAERQIGAIEAERAGEEARRRAALRRAVGRSRADLAGRGLGADGSGEAILLGLTKEAEAEDAAGRQAAALRAAAVAQDLDQTRRRNLLALTEATQRRNFDLLALYAPRD
ncbi:MAG TPA: hypothetical protein VEB20_23275 [Azospirillaceae bacterium]|nr:hypothetical protein [Azospirillaceae bacterium]